MIRPILAVYRLLDNYYWTTTVAALAPDWLLTVPTVTTTGWVPVGAVAGIVTLTCMTPEMMLGAEPA